jgi:transposase
MGRPIKTLRVTQGSLEELKRLMRQKGLTNRQRVRGKIVLLRAFGSSQDEISNALGVSRPTISKWVKRFNSMGIDGLYDIPHIRRPPLPVEKIQAARSCRARSLSARDTAKKLKLSLSSVYKIRNGYRVNVVPEI